MSPSWKYNQGEGSPASEAFEDWLAQLDCEPSPFADWDAGLDAVAHLLMDLSADIQIQAQDCIDLSARLELDSGVGFWDLAVILDASSGEAFADSLAEMCVVKAKPTFNAIVAQRLSAVVREV